MLEALKFVRGSIAKKDFLPALTHFVIENNTVRGYNGTIALCSPIPFGISCKPKAEPLVRAIGNCDGPVQLSLTPAGRLSVKSNAFKAFVDCAAEEETPHVLPEGEVHRLADGAAVLEAVRAVAPFIGSDASRTWASGVLFRDGSVFATNNVCLVQQWLGAAAPQGGAFNLPEPAVKEMLRIGEPPLKIQSTDNSVTLHYSGDRWLRSQLLPTNWPDLARVLDRPSSPEPIPDLLFAGLDVVKPFVDKLGRVFFRDGHIHTATQEGEGASYEVPGLPEKGIYNVEMLELLNGTATKVDFSTWPGPAMFFGGKLRGAIIGMRG